MNKYDIKNINFKTPFLTILRNLGLNLNEKTGGISNEDIEKIIYLDAKAFYKHYKNIEKSTNCKLFDRN